MRTRWKFPKASIRSSNQIQKEYPDLKFEISFDQAESIKESLTDLRIALYLAIILVVLIVYLFLYNVRGTFIVALAIPTCIFASFIAIYFFGFTINFDDDAGAFAGGGRAGGRCDCGN
jgi:HAE1 family hydrophobic/amphiphilic exporter-1